MLLLETKTCYHIAQCATGSDNGQADTAAPVRVHGTLQASSAIACRVMSCHVRFGDTHVLVSLVAVCAVCMMGVLSVVRA